MQQVHLKLRHRPPVPYSKNIIEKFVGDRLYLYIEWIQLCLQKRVLNSQTVIVINMHIIVIYVFLLKFENWKNIRITNKLR